MNIVNCEVFNINDVIAIIITDKHVKISLYTFIYIYIYIYIM